MNAIAAPMAHAQPAANNNTLETVWQIYAQNLNSGTCSYIEMPFNLKAVFGKRGLEIIAFRFSTLIQAPVTTFEDPDRGVIQIVPSRNDHGHDSTIPGARDPKVKTAKKAKVARPANAFILYRQHHHPLVKSQQPDIHNNQISVILGDQWKNESQSTKARFINMALQLKAKHLLEHPEYQYQPRKPSEKKRRMTQRKKAALAETSHSKPKPSTTPAVVVLDAPFAANEIAAPVPMLPETLGGNAMLEIGDEDLDEGTLTAMLEQYNKSRPQFNNQIAAIVTQSSPPVMYSEPTEEAQEQKNFYSNLHDFDPFESNDNLSEDMDAAFQGEAGFAAYRLQHQAKFDEQHEPLFNAELNRMCHWDQEPFFYQG